MKKFTLLCVSMIIIFFGIVNVSIAEDIFTIADIEGQAQAAAEDALAPVVKSLSGSLNSGLYAPVSGTIASIGIQLNYTMVPKEGLLFENSTNNTSALPVPFLYAGGRIPLIGINVLARALVLPIENNEGKYPTLIGLGIGWEPGLIPFFSTKVMLTYHWISNFPLLPTIYSLYPNITVAFTKVPFITPYANIGLSYTKLGTAVKLFPTDAENFSMSEVHMNTAIGVKLFFITLEVAVLPTTTYSLSAGLSF